MSYNKKSPSKTIIETTKKIQEEYKIYRNNLEPDTKSVILTEEMFAKLKKTVQFEINMDYVYVPQEILNENLCIDFIRHNYYNFQNVPKELITKKMCHFAIKKNGWSIKNIPKELLTEKMCIASLINCKFDDEKYPCDYFKHIPQELLTEKLCLVALEKDVYNIKYFPHIIMTKEMCSIIINKKPFGIEHFIENIIPKNLLTEDLYLKVIKLGGYYIRSMYEDLLTKKICIESLKKNVENFKYIPKSVLEKYFPGATCATNIIEPLK